MTTSHDDLTIDELLDDPMTQAIMQADRVDRSALEAMLRALASLLAHPAERTNDGDLALERASARKAFGRFLRSTCRDGGERSRQAATRSRIQPQVCSAR
jgi:hypothetical protein